jgi:hypothetical protein
MLDDGAVLGWKPLNYRVGLFKITQKSGVAAALPA